MDVKFKARSLWNTGKEMAVKCTRALTSGIRFSELYSVYLSYFRVIIPSGISHPVDCAVAFVLFHVYLLYILVFCISLSVLKNFRIKGSGIAPMSGSLKEKAAIYMTYFFVFQSISKWTLGIATFDRMVGWAFQLKPQINLKPQIKIGKSKSNESVVSVKNKMEASLNCGFESEDEDTRKTIKKLGKVKKNVDFVSEIADALIVEEESHGWQDANSSLELLPTEEQCDSVYLVQKWLSDSNSVDSEDVKKHVMKVMAENEQMRRQSMMHNSESDEIGA